MTDTQLLAPAVADSSEFRRTMSRFPTFVTVITVPGVLGPTGCTATAVLSLSLDPPTMLVSLRSAGRTLEELIAAGRFGVNALAWDQRDLIRRFATGRPEDRFGGVPHTRTGGVPMLTGASAGVVCEVRGSVTALDHTLVVGEVRHVVAGSAAPLVLLDGETHRIQERTDR